MSSEVQGPGSPAHIAAIAAMRHLLDATEVVCTWDTPHGIVSVEIDEDGFEMYVNGERVPKAPKPLRQGPMPS